MTDGKGQWDGQGQLELESKRIPTKTSQSQTKPADEIPRYHLVGHLPSLLKFSPYFSYLGKQLIPCIRALVNSSGSQSSLKALLG